MNSIENLIKIYLLENKTLILPDLGTLTITNEETNEIMFMPYLKYDDKKLNGFLQEKNNISEEEASTTINNWVQEVQEKIKNEGTFAIADLGVFSQNENGDLDFNSHSNKPNSTIENVAEDITATLAETNVAIEEMTETFDKPTDEEPITSNEIKKEISVPSESKEIEEKLEEITPKIEEIPTPIVPEEEQISETLATMVENEATKEETEVPNEDATNSISSKENSEPKKRKKSGINVFLLILAILILICGIIGTVFYDQIDQYFHPKKVVNTEVSTPNSSDEETTTSNQSATSNTPEEENTTTTNDQQGSTTNSSTEANTMSNDSETEAQKPVETPTSVSKPTPETTTNAAAANGESGYYYIIVGAFQEATNASRLQQRLSANGTESEILAVGGFNMVTAGKFNNGAEAQTKLNELGQGWILKK